MYEKKPIVVSFDIKKKIKQMSDKKKEKDKSAKLPKITPDVSKKNL